MLIANLQPTPLPRGALDGLDQLLHAKSGPKVEGLIHAARDGVQEASNLDRFQIIESELMPGCYAEEAVGRMLGASIDAAKTATSGRIGGAVEMQLVEVLLAEGERALGGWCSAARPGWSTACPPSRGGLKPSS